MRRDERRRRRRRLLMAARLLGAAALGLAVACCVLVALTQGHAQHPPRHPYWPFTVEAVVRTWAPTPGTGSTRRRSRRR